MFDFYPEYEQLLARTQLVLFMTGMGMALAPADFLQIIRQPRSLMLGVVGQLVLAPLIAFVIILIGGFEAGIATGLLLVAALPGGNLSKVFTFVARGNVALSISLSALATLLSVISIPLVLRLGAGDALPREFSVPVDLIIIYELILFLLAPLFTGMVLARFMRRWKDTISKWLIRSGLVIAVFMVTCSIGTGRVKGHEYGWAVPLAIILFCVLSQQFSMLTFRLLRWPSRDTVAVGIETTMRNINLALAIVALLFPASGPANPVGDGIWFVALYYAAVGFFATIPLTLRMRRVIRRQQTLALETDSPTDSQSAFNPTVTSASLPGR
jgi:bile acid:Na+ symporter, BASS family